MLRCRSVLLIVYNLEQDIALWTFLVHCSTALFNIVTQENRIDHKDVLLLHLMRLQTKPLP